MRVGYAKFAITPPPGLRMDGYISRDSPAQGSLDDLYLRAAELDGVFLASLDLIAVNPILSRRGAVAATHTHSGPSICHYAMSWHGCGEEEGQYVLGLSRLISSAEPQPLGSTHLVVWGEAEISDLCAPRVGSSRNILLKAAAVERLLVTIIPCHPTVLGPENLKYSSDIFGIVASTLEEKGYKPILLQGASGDVSTRRTRRSRDYSEVQRIGRALAERVLKAISSGDVVQAGVKYDETKIVLRLRFRRDAVGEAGEVISRVSKIAPKRVAARIGLLRLGGGEELLLVPFEPAYALQEELGVELVGVAYDYLGYLAPPGDYYESYMTFVDFWEALNALKRALEDLRNT